MITIVTAEKQQRIVREIVNAYKTTGMRPSPSQWKGCSIVDFDFPEIGKECYGCALAALTGSSSDEAIRKAMKLLDVSYALALGIITGFDSKYNSVFVGQYLDTGLKATEQDAYDFMVGARLGAAIVSQALDWWRKEGEPADRARRHQALTDARKAKIAKLEAEIARVQAECSSPVIESLQADLARQKTILQNMHNPSKESTP